MLRRLSSFFAVAALVAATSTAARADIREVTVVNDTPSCAIVSAYETSGNRIDGLVPGPNPRHLRSHAEFDLRTSSAPNVQVTGVRVRVEIKANPDCTGATIEELHQSERATRPSAEYVEAAIFKSKVGYRIRFLPK